MKKQFILLLLTILILTACSLSNNNSDIKTNTKNSDLINQSQNQTNEINSEKSGTETVNDAIKEIDTDLNNLDANTDFGDQTDKDFNY